MAVMGRAGTGKPGTGRPGTSRLCLTQDPEADQLLEDDPFALLIGMLLDQQIPMETAFAGPRKLADRLGGLEPAEIAGYDPAKFAEICAKSPAVHRFPGSMAKRLQKLARTVVDDYGGDAAAIWTMGEPDGTEVLRRLTSLPGFAEGADISGIAGKAVRGQSGRMAGGGRGLRRSRCPDVHRRCGGQGHAGAGAGVQEEDEDGSEIGWKIGCKIG